MVNQQWQFEKLKWPIRLWGHMRSAKMGNQPCYKYTNKWHRLKAIERLTRFALFALYSRRRVNFRCHLEPPNFKAVLVYEVSSNTPIKFFNSSFKSSQGETTQKTDTDRAAHADTYNITIYVLTWYHYNAFLLTIQIA